MDKTIYTIYLHFEIYFKAICLSILYFFVPIHGLFALIGMLIAIDTITGLIKAYKLKERITSRKLSQVIVKMLLYQLTVMTFFILDHLILGEFASSFSDIPNITTKLCTLALVIVESKSIIENYEIAFNVNVWETLISFKSKVSELLGGVRGVDKYDEINNKL